MAVDFSDTFNTAAFAAGWTSISPITGGRFVRRGCATSYCWTCDTAQAFKTVTTRTTGAQRLMYAIYNQPLVDASFQVLVFQDAGGGCPNPNFQVVVYGHQQAGVNVQCLRVRITTGLCTGGGQPITTDYYTPDNSFPQDGVWRAVQATVTITGPNVTVRIVIDGVTTTLTQVGNSWPLQNYNQVALSVQKAPTISPVRFSAVDSYENDTSDAVTAWALCSGTIALSPSLCDPGNCPGLTLTAVSVDPFTNRVTLTGTGFSADTVVALTNPAGVVLPTTVVSQTATQIVVSASAGVPGQYCVSVTNPDVPLEDDPGAPIPPPSGDCTPLTPGAIPGLPAWFEAALIAAGATKCYNATIFAAIEATANANSMAPQRTSGCVIRERLHEGTLTQIHCSKPMVDFTLPFTDHNIEKNGFWTWA